MAAVLALVLSVTAGILGVGSVVRSVDDVRASVAAAALYRTALTNSLASDANDLAASATVSWNQGRCGFEQDQEAAQQQMTCTSLAQDDDGAPYLIKDRYLYTVGDGKAESYYKVLDVTAAKDSSLTTSDIRSGYRYVLGKWDRYYSAKADADWLGMGARNLSQEGPMGILAGVQHIFQASYFDESLSAHDRASYLKALTAAHPFRVKGVTQHVRYQGIDDVTRLTVTVTRAAYHAFDQRLASTLSSSVHYSADSTSFDDSVFGRTGVLTAQIYLDANTRIVGVATTMPLAAPVPEKVYGTTMSTVRTSFTTLYGQSNELTVPADSKTISDQAWSKALDQGMGSGFGGA
ncbi:hypothetical protein [Humibacter ginsenosidimutans]|uniref:Uncharacterized protein n=1 Tax=Humibacter ginsenosidimutans TaxID=2599293 RepID=A0A5B8M4A4_9MICO|nr:hypothetical protein [Humibacter ginsenosidimutans]QDZ15031.1 hypothetical protein FPZ11_09845 [Humibacter ginsenosidimutans]